MINVIFVTLLLSIASSLEGQMKYYTVAVLLENAGENKNAEVKALFSDDTFPEISTKLATNPTEVGEIDVVFMLINGKTEIIKPTEEWYRSMSVTKFHPFFGVVESPKVPQFSAISQDWPENSDLTEQGMWKNYFVRYAFEE